ncbi:hypothetical protein PSYAR_15547 [Pseudomonas syringae pv. aceris str. M302273]|nr:hypothetical protein PSYAR_15547 [Pseudomonas syringae pv. aceris str. M302273]
MLAAIRASAITNLFCLKLLCKEARIQNVFDDEDYI